MKSQTTDKKKNNCEMVKENFEVWGFFVLVFSKIKDNFENISLKIILDWS